MEKTKRKQKIQTVYTVRYLVGKEWANSNIAFKTKEVAESWGKGFDAYYVIDLNIYESINQYLDRV